MLHAGCRVLAAGAGKHVARDVDVSLSHMNRCRFARLLRVSEANHTPLVTELSDTR
jgi:hypothetical protein